MTRKQIEKKTKAIVAGVLMVKEREVRPDAWLVLDLNADSISRNEYLSLRKEMVAVSNQVVNDRIDSKIDLIRRGWNIGRTIEQLESERNMYLK